MGVAVAVEQLPGGDLVERGVADLAHGRPTVEAALVSMAATRLRALGFDVPAFNAPQPAGHALYERLERRDPDTAYSQYKALTRRLASFLHAATPS